MITLKIHANRANKITVYSVMLVAVHLVISFTASTIRNAWIAEQNMIRTALNVNLHSAFNVGMDMD